VFRQPRASIGTGGREILVDTARERDPRAFYVFPR
jgi:hypothetical protein